MEGSQTDVADKQLDPAQEIEKLEQKNEKLTKENKELKRNNKELNETANSRQETNKALITQLNETKKQCMVLEEQKKDKRTPKMMTHMEMNPKREKAKVR